MYINTHTHTHTHTHKVHKTLFQGGQAVRKVLWPVLFTTLMTFSSSR